MQPFIQYDKLNPFQETSSQEINEKPKRKKNNDKKK